MSNLAQILLQNYSIIPVDILPMAGGLSASAYKIQAADEAYLLKVYDKSKKATAQWTSLIDHYVPILTWLNQNTDLKNRIVNPIRTVNEENSCEDEDCIYLLFSYIQGQTVGESTLTTAQAMELAHIVGILHQNSSDTIPGFYGRMTEDFSLSFCKDIDFFIENKVNDSGSKIRSIATRYLPQLKAASGRAAQMADKFSKTKPALVFCHTDIHNFNILQGERLVLIDWEGIKLAPPEHDLMFIYGKPYYEEFMPVYKCYHPDFKLNIEILDFYFLRRKLEDIWAFIEAIINDGLEEADLNRRMYFLETICASLSNNSRAF